MDKVVIESAEYYHHQLSKGLIKKSENHGTTYYIFEKNGLNKSDILLYFGTLIFMRINQINTIIGVGILFMAQYS